MVSPETSPDAVLALVPARGGSRSIPRKNIRPLNGQPLIAYAISAGLRAARVGRVVVSTDDEEIAAVARACGAEVPFLRPADLARDETPDFPVFRHALEWFEREEGYRPEIVVQLRPTSPIRPPALVDDVIRALAARPDADSARTATVPSQNPYKMWRIVDSWLEPLLASDLAGPYNRPRQALPETFWQTGHVDAVRRRTLLELGSMTGRRSLPCPVDARYAVDIDSPLDWENAEWVLRHAGIDCVRPPLPPLDRFRGVVFDFDGVFTDNHVYIFEDGRESVACNRADGLGIAALREAGYALAVLSGESNGVVTARCAKLGMICRQGGAGQGCRAPGPRRRARPRPRRHHLRGKRPQRPGLPAHGRAPRGRGRCAPGRLEGGSMDPQPTGRPRRRPRALRPNPREPQVIGSHARGNTVRIGNHTVGHGHPVFIVAEIGINYNGDLETARALIDHATDAGCDAVKFQKRTSELCVPPDQRDLPRETPWGVIPYIEYRRRVELSAEAYREMDHHCRGRGILWFASCWDEPAVDFIEAFDPPCFKIQSAAVTDFPLLARLEATGRPLILSTGMSSMEEIRAAVSFLATDDLVILHATSAYPCALDELNLRVIPALRAEFPHPIGYSGHEVGLPTTIAAVALGACLVERHVTLDRAMWGTDQAASIEPHGLRKLVHYIRTVEAALGDGAKQVYPSELPAIARLRRPRFAPGLTPCTTKEAFP